MDPVRSKFFMKAAVQCCFVSIGSIRGRFNAHCKDLHRKGSTGPSKFALPLNVLVPNFLSWLLGLFFLWQRGAFLD